MTAVVQNTREGGSMLPFVRCVLNPLEMKVCTMTRTTLFWLTVLVVLCLSIAVSLAPRHSFPSVPGNFGAIRTPAWK